MKAVWTNCVEVNIFRRTLASGTSSCRGHPSLQPESHPNQRPTPSRRGECQERGDFPEVQLNFTICL